MTPENNLVFGHFKPIWAHIAVEKPNWEETIKGDDILKLDIGHFGNPNDAVKKDIDGKWEIKEWWGVKEQDWARRRIPAFIANCLLPA